MSIEFPTNLDDAVAAASRPGVEIRAGGTDLQERLASRPFDTQLVDLTRVDGLRSIVRHDDGAVDLGALVPIARAATDLHDSHSALALTAGGLATPQVRAVATVGGNLTQQTRCSYARHPDLSCHKSGGDSCPARTASHGQGIVFDTGPCVHPHPSSIGAALLAHRATFTTTARAKVPIVELFGDGADPSRDHLLAHGEILTAVHLPPAHPAERAAYHRAISRFEAEWPLVEAVSRLAVVDDVIVDAHVAVGGVSPVPMRLDNVADELVGSNVSPAVLRRAAQLAADGATPLEASAYKVDLLVGCVTEVLERAASTRSAHEA